MLQNGVVNMPLKIKSYKTLLPILELISKEFIEKLSVEQRENEHFSHVLKYEPKEEVCLLRAWCQPQRHTLTGMYRGKARETRSELLL